MKTAVAIALTGLCIACDKTPIAPTREPDPGPQPPPIVRPIDSPNYMLTIAAADECVGTGKLPEEARIRTYQAAVEQDGAQLRIRVASPTTTYGFFFGKVEEDRVTFDLAWYDDSGEPEPSIVEQLSTEDFLAVRGHATTTGSFDRLAGTLRGDVWVFATEGAWWRRTSLCTSENHRFVLTR